MRKDLLQRNLVFNATLLNNDEVKINTATLDIKWHTYENRPIKVMDHKVLSGISYKDAAKSHLKVAIIDKDNPYGKITTEREILVKKTPMVELDKIILSASCSKTNPPTFRSWSHSGEIIRVTCDDDLTLEWLKTKVPTIKTWEGATRGSAS
ncbi:unnamed protein product [Psylliodes chrysocephalus]|uniref:DUF4780 domain-containing protein n=1 Tax=Psylliodes chrysocephalus TaxID=3402493 RepID=A0A9P0CUC5_9CUCU|nr:unnamed protein product [Psylliodes chrysocephala]